MTFSFKFCLLCIVHKSFAGATDSFYAKLFSQYEHDELKYPCKSTHFYLVL